MMAICKGTPDLIVNCPIDLIDEWNTQPDQCGCGRPDTDVDEDGTLMPSHDSLMQRRTGFGAEMLESRAVFPRSLDGGCI